jgi:hypothetical protein
MLQVKKRTPIVSPSIIFTFELTFESIKELGGASKNIYSKVNELLGNLLSWQTITNH